MSEPENVSIEITEAENKKPTIKEKKEVKFESAENNNEDKEITNIRDNVFNKLGLNMLNRKIKKKLKYKFKIKCIEFYRLMTLVHCLGKKVVVIHLRICVDYTENLIEYLIWKCVIK